MMSVTNSSANAKAITAINALKELKLSKLRSVASPIVSPGTANNSLEIEVSNDMNELCNQLNDFTLTPSRLVVDTETLNSSINSPSKLPTRIKFWWKKMNSINNFCNF